FELGKCKVLRASRNDRVLVVAGGITVHEALSAHEQLLREGISIRVIDLFSIRPLDKEELVSSALAAGNRVLTVEDHYAHGGLGDAVASVLGQTRCRIQKLAVREIPHSGKPAELLEKFGISAGHIAHAVKGMLA